MFPADTTPKGPLRRFRYELFGRSFNQARQDSRESLTSRSALPFGGDSLRKAAWIASSAGLAGSAEADGTAGTNAGERIARSFRTDVHVSRTWHENNSGK